MKTKEENHSAEVALAKKRVRPTQKQMNELREKLEALEGVNRELMEVQAKWQERSQSLEKELLKRHEEIKSLNDRIESLKKSKRLTEGQLEKVIQEKSKLDSDLFHYKELSDQRLEEILLYKRWPILTAIRYRLGL